MATLGEVLQSVRVGDSFYRAAKPDVLYERIGALIERDGLGWATLKRSLHCEWDIMPEMSIAEDNEATDWILQKDASLNDFNPKARPPKRRPLISEKTRHGWTYYDQTTPPPM
jgi:hypothetical protein